MPSCASKQGANAKKSNLASVYFGLHMGAGLLEIFRERRAQRRVAGKALLWDLGERPGHERHPCQRSPWQQRDGATRRLDPLADRRACGFCSGREYRGLERKLAPARLIEAWRFLHPGYRYVLLLGGSQAESRRSPTACWVKTLKTGRSETSTEINFVGGAEQIAVLKANAAFEEDQKADAPKRVEFISVDWSDAAQISPHLVLIDTPGFGSQHVTNFKDAAGAKDLLNGMLPLVDHLVYLVQPTDPTNDVDGFIASILGEDIAEIPLTVVLTQIALYQKRILGGLRFDNIKWAEIDSAIKEIEDFFDERGAPALQRDDNFFLCETSDDLPDEWRAQPKADDVDVAAVREGLMLVKAPRNEYVHGHFVETIDPLRARVLGSREPSEAFINRRLEKVQAKWDDLITGLDERLTFFLVRTELALNKASENQSDYRRIVDARAVALQEFWSGAQEQLARIEGGVRVGCESVNEAIDAHAMRLGHALTAERVQVTAAHISNWTQNLREVVAVAAAERASTLATTLTTQVRTFVNDWEDVDDPREKLDQLKFRLGSSIDAPAILGYTLPENYFAQRETEANLHAEFKDIVRHAVDKGLRGPGESLAKIAKDVDLIDVYDKLDEGLTGRIKTTIDRAEESLSRFRKIISLDAGAADRDVEDLREEEYEQNLAKLLRLEVSRMARERGNDPTKGLADLVADQRARLRIAFGPVDENRKRWRDEVTAALGALGQAMEAACGSAQSEILLEAMSAIEPAPAPDLGGLQQVLSTATGQIDANIRNAAKARAVILVKRLERALAVRAGRKMNKQSRWTALAVATGAGGLWLLLAWALFSPAGVESWGVDLSEQRDALLSTLAQTTFALLTLIIVTATALALTGRKNADGSYLERALNWIAVKARGRRPNGARPILPSS